MARKPRIEFEGAVYHIVCRGDGGDDIVRDDVDRNRLVESLGQVCEKTGWVVHAYCILSNHYHLLLETPAANLVVGMKWLQGTYSQRFNARHKRRGHVFQGRYKSLLVDPELSGYFGTVSTYIHLNPVRAGLLREKDLSLIQYRWSSYPSYIKKPSQRPEWLEVTRVLAESGGLHDDGRGRRSYADYVDQRARDLKHSSRREDMEKEWKSIRRGWCVGGDEFRDALQERLGQLLNRNKKASYCGDSITQHDETHATILLSRGLDVLGLRQEDLPALAKSDPKKAVLAWVIKSRTAVSSEWISHHLHMGHISNISNCSRRVAESKEKELLRLRRRVEMIPKI